VSARCVPCSGCTEAGQQASCCTATAHHSLAKVLLLLDTAATVVRLSRVSAVELPLAAVAVTTACCCHCCCWAAAAAESGLLALALTWWCGTACCCCWPAGMRVAFLESANTGAGTAAGGGPAFLPLAVVLVSLQASSNVFAAGAEMQQLQPRHLLYAGGALAVLLLLWRLRRRAVSPRSTAGPNSGIADAVTS
jgi:hypothetical protein